MQLFGPSRTCFSKEDAQLLWILSLVVENLLTRDFANEALIKFAFTDFLTGMKTRGYFETQLEREIKRAERSKGPLALVMIDIDHFKILNDTHGHHVGDVLLRDLSTVLMKDMRQIDTVARYGGEEFVLILPETNNVGAYRVAQRLRKAVESARFFAGSPSDVVKLTISMGIAVFPQDAQFKRDLIEASDTALYEAKRTGRNRVVLCSELDRKRRSHDTQSASVARASIDDSNLNPQGKCDRTVQRSRLRAWKALHACNAYESISALSTPRARQACCPRW